MTLLVVLPVPLWCFCALLKVTNFWIPFFNVLCVLILIGCLCLLLHILIFSCFFYVHTFDVHSIRRPSCLYQRRCDCHFCACPDPVTLVTYFVNLIAFMKSSRQQTSLTSEYLAVLRPTTLTFCIHALVGHNSVMTLLSFASRTLFASSGQLFGRCWIHPLDVQ